MDSPGFFLIRRSQFSVLIIKGLLISRALNHLFTKYSDIKKYIINPENMEYLVITETGSAQDGYIKYGIIHKKMKNNLY